MKKHFPFLIALVGLLLGSSVFLAGAADPPALSEEEAVDFSCGVAVAEAGESELQAYMEFLDEYFQSATPTSELVQQAQLRSRYYNEAINTAFEEQVLIQGQKTFDVAFDEFNYCINIRDQYLDAARGMLQIHAIQSGGSKRTYQVVDGLKALNENMAELSTSFTLTFPRMFEKMDNALPCYVRECITQ